MTNSLRTLLRTSSPCSYKAEYKHVQYSPSVVEPETPHPERPSNYPLWTMKDGTDIRLEDMNLRHLQNCRAMVLRKLEKVRFQTPCYYGHPFDPDTEAYYCCESEMDYDPASEYAEIIDFFDREIAKRMVQVQMGKR